MAELNGEALGWCDPMFSFKALSDVNLVEYYCEKFATQKPDVSPMSHETDKERAKRDPYFVLTKAQNKKMKEVRESHKVELHKAAVNELARR